MIPEEMIMFRRTLLAVTAFSLAAFACGGSHQKGPAPGTGADEPAKPTSDPHAVFGPLEVGADWQSYTKLNTEPVQSEDHGGRFVDTYVNAKGVEAYKNPDAEIPVGTVVVKVSWENEGGKPTDKQGPIFVMEKKAPGYDDENENWYYAIHWAEPVEPMRKKYGQIYWRSPSPKVKYCFDCHNGYDRQLGMIPEGKRAW